MAAAPPPKLNADILLRGPPEVRRLTEHYVYMKRVFDHTELLPPNLDLSRVHRVLDVAAGTGIWAFDLTDAPTVRPRLAPNASNPLEIYICDISTSNFPPSELLRSVGIRAFQQDVTEPFPMALCGTFDLVHMTCLGLTFNESQWKLALKNVRDVLRPGGYLILQECDPILYTQGSPPPPDGHPHDVPSVMKGSTVVSKTNCVLTGLALKSRYLVDLSYRFPSLLQATGLIPISKERALCPYGALCDVYSGLRGSPLHSMRGRSADTFSSMLDSFTRALLRRGWLEAPLGVKIQSEDQRRALSDDLRRAVANGVLVVASEWIVQRPLSTGRV